MSSVKNEIHAIVLNRPLPKASAFGASRSDIASIPLREFSDSSEARRDEFSLG
jgi:hypothetical protein